MNGLYQMFDQLNLGRHLLNLMAGLLLISIMASIFTGIIFLSIWFPLTMGLGAVIILVLTFAWAVGVMLRNDF